MGAPRAASKPPTIGPSGDRAWSRDLAPRIAGALCLLLLAPFGLPELGAQEAPRTDFHTGYGGIGYVVNAPDVLIGVGAFVLLEGGFGAYVDFKTSHDSPGREDNFLPNLTRQSAEELGDLRLRQKNAYRSFNGAVLRRLSGDITVYAGAGVTRRSEYHEFEDPEGERGFLGLYWAEDEAESGSRLNLLGGAFFHAGRHVVLQFGFESEPTGLTAGALVALPF